MAFNDELDNQAADLRGIETDSQQPQPNSPAVPETGKPERNVSKAEIILAVGIMIGAVTIVYMLLQKQSSSFSEPPLVHLPLPVNPKGNSK